MADARRESDRNKAIVRTFVEAVQGGGDLARLGEFVAEDHVNLSNPPEAPRGTAAVEANFRRLREAFPDHDVEIVVQVAEDDLVATLKTYTGTHLGEFLGVAPTGRRATLTVVDIVRMVDGKVADHWAVTDVERVRRELEAHAARPPGG